MTSATSHIEHERYKKIVIDRLGLWLFLLSESMLFAGLLAGRFYLEGTNRPDELSQVLGLIITSILLVSSLTMYRAEIAIKHDAQQAFLTNTLLTILLGLIFVGGVAYEWVQAFEHFPPETSFGTVFFSMTGMHAFHVISGVLVLILLYWNGRRGRFSAQNAWPPEAVAKYWHMVDVVWVFFYAALYLV